MRSLRYLNSVLSVIAILLSLHVWALWSGGPAETLSLATPAHAAGYPAGLPNASSQRRDMVDLLKRLNQQTEELIGLFKTGKARIKMELPKQEKNRGK